MEWYYNDESSMLSAIQMTGGFAFRMVSDNLRFSESFVKKAIEITPWIVTYLPKKMVTKEIVLSAVEREHFVLIYLDREWNCDRDVMKTVLQINGAWLFYCSSCIRMDAAMVRIAVTQCGRAIKYAAPSLRRDRALALVAIQQDELAYLHVNIYDNTFLEEAMSMNRKMLRFVPKDDRVFFRRCGPNELRFLLRNAPLPYYLPDDLIWTHLLPFYFRE